MNLSSEIKEQIVAAIEIQKSVIDEMRSTSPTTDMGNKLKNINMTFDNLLKARQVIDLYIGQVEAETFLNDGEVKEDILI